MNIYKNGVMVDSYMPLYGGKKIIVAIDSSKSNTAMIVGDEYGNILDDYEISGAGGNVDVYDLVKDTRAQLKTLFQGAEIILVGIENIITKNEKGYKGIEIHQSRYKITAVFDNLIFYFQEFHNIMPKLINNQEWKAAVLPEEYRKRDHKKGSKDWFMSIGNRWADRKDDITDAVCIFTYLLKTSEIKVTYKLKETRPARNTYSIGIFPSKMEMPKGSKEFIIENKDSLEHNLAMISNNINDNQIGYIRVDLDLVPIDWIYSDRLKYNSKITYNRNEKDVILAVSIDKSGGE